MTPPGLVILAISTNVCQKNESCSKVELDTSIYPKRRARLNSARVEVARDPARAKDLLKQAVERGHIKAALQLGNLYSGKLPAYTKELNATEAIK
jgi:hypothetical protein